jgi:hypothetical protein
MLRSTQPLLTSSARALGANRAHLGLSQLLSSRARNLSAIADSAARRSLVTSDRFDVAQKLRYATKSPSGLQQGIDLEEESKFRKQKLEQHPESVTTESSVRHAYEPDNTPSEKPVKDGVMDDLVCLLSWTWCLAEDYD